MKTQNKIVIIVEGGIVQDVFTDAGTEYTVIDHDTEGAPLEAPNYATQPIEKLDQELTKLLH